MSFTYPEDLLARRPARTDVFSDEVVNAADLGGNAAPATWAQPDPPGRTIGRFWLAVAAAALVTGAYA
jgi:hypothetical protein